MGQNWTPILGQFCTPVDTQDTHRGIVGRVLNGFSGGGRKYGYRSEPVHGAAAIQGARPIGFQLVVDQAEAQVVIKVFELYAYKWFGPKAIARILNSELREVGTPPSPTGGYWSAGTIGHMLRNELYTGVYIWNRSRSIEDPLSRRRKSVVNDPTTWTIKEMPELRIVPDKLWEAAKRRFERISEPGTITPKALASEHLLTGFLRCGICGGNFVITSGGKKGKYGCSINWNKGEQVCANGLHLDREQTEERVIQFLCQQLIDDSAHSLIVAECDQAFAQYLAQLREVYSHEQLEQRLQQVKQEHSNIIDAIRMGFRDPALMNTLKDLRQKQIDILNLIKATHCPPSRLHDLITTSAIKEYFWTIAKQVKNPETTRSAIDMVVDRIVINPSSFGLAESNIIEKPDYFSEFLYEALARSDPRIRYETGTRFVPYTPRIFNMQLPAISRNSASKSNKGVPV